MTMGSPVTVSSTAPQKHVPTYTFASLLMTSLQARPRIAREAVRPLTTRRWPVGIGGEPAIARARGLAWRLRRATRTLDTETPRQLSLQVTVLVGQILLFQLLDKYIYRKFRPGRSAPPGPAAATSG